MGTICEYVALLVIVGNDKKFMVSTESETGTELPYAIEYRGGAVPEEFLYTYEEAERVSSLARKHRDETISVKPLPYILIVTHVSELSGEMAA